MRVCHVAIGVTVAVALTAAVGLPWTGAAQSGGDTTAANPGNGVASLADPHGTMGHFYSRLSAVEALDAAKPIARVMFYTESTNAADRVSSALRHRLQDRFGDAGKGFVPATPGWRVQRHQDIRWETSGPWQSWVVNRRNGPNHRYGLAGVLSQSDNPSASAEFGTVVRGPVGRSVSRFSIFYQAFPGAGELAYRIDGGPPQQLPTAAEDIADRMHTMAVSDGPHSLQLSPESEHPIRLYGVAMERDGPGVVVDGLMLVGAFTRVLGQFDSTHWQQQIAARDPHLLMFWFGGNDASSQTTHFSKQRYVRNYARSIRRARRGKPSASCLVVSILDAAEEKRGDVRTLARVPRVVAAQEEVAQQTNCAFFNLYQAAGGYNTMVRWRRQGLASGDYKHLTRRGAHRVGALLFDALIGGYSSHRSSDGRSSDL